MRSGARFSSGVADVRARRGTFPSTAPISTTDASPIRVPCSTTTFGPNSTPSPRLTSSPTHSPRALFAGRSIHSPSSETTSVRRPRARRRRGGTRRATAAGPRGRARPAPPSRRPRAARAPPPALAVGGRRAPIAHGRDEVLALEPQRLVVRHARGPDVARARDVLAVGVRLLVEALVVDGPLPLGVHVVERRHPPRPDDREAAFLVRVEPREVQ